MTSSALDLEGIARAVTRAVEARGAKWIAARGEFEFRCPMPLHEDKHPSAYWNPGKMVWNCWGCGQEGGMFGERPDKVALAPLLGIDVARHTDPARAALLAEKREVEKRLAEERAAKAAAAAEYWRAHRAEQALVQRRDVLAMLLRDGISEETVVDLRWSYDTVRTHDGERWVDWPAVLIPWFDGEMQNVVMVQHRLIGSEAPGGRYRSQGRTDTLFNARRAAHPVDDVLIVVEGAKKAACLETHGVRSVVAVVNKGGWQEKFARRLAGFDRVVFLPDPDARDEATAAALTIAGGRGRVATLREKPDDFLIRTGDPDLLMRRILAARRVD